MTKLSVNINKVATIRNARGGKIPDVVKFAIECEKFGADGITVHPRPDGRHITYDDVLALKKVVTTEFNIEGYPSQSFLKLVADVRPTQATLVPDPPEALTSNDGWDTVKNFDFLSDVCSFLKENGIRSSIFVNPIARSVEKAAEAGADRVELYTEPYARLYNENRNIAIAPFVEAAKMAREVNLGLNAGHDLNLENLAFFHQNIPWLDEVSIGHALISDALYFGIKETIHRYLSQLKS
ncbi:MAG: pyridoxine 5'-phosphate synthase [Muribaculaceae bacterium]|nr:pyridoxine 5'-phosphate synthase [Muribaculaceae bacterium]